MTWTLLVWTFVALRSPNLLSRQSTPLILYVLVSLVLWEYAAAWLGRGWPGLVSSRRSWPSILPSGSILVLRGPCCFGNSYWTLYSVWFLRILAHWASLCFVVDSRMAIRCSGVAGQTYETQEIWILGAISCQLLTAFSVDFVRFPWICLLHLSCLIPSTVIFVLRCLPVSRNFREGGTYGHVLLVFGTWWRIS